ncbi:MAG: hypothetical protein J6P66_04665 [Bacteroidaceae bacterium]|nr:hypothetical protein [Bacteroidaceae bacterium]MBO7050989.1 hypothetical protein [Bacteroidaceae bacterium]
MKRIFILLTVITGLVLAGCSEKEKLVDDPTYSILGQWVAQTPLTGERQDMQSSEPALAPYDHVVVVLSVFEKTCNSAVFYLYGDELIGLDYGVYLAGECDYSMDRDGNISIMNNPQISGHFRNARYEKGQINVNLSIREGDLALAFNRPTAEQLQVFAEWMNIIYSAMGYSDQDAQQITDIINNPAEKPAD